MAQLNILFLNYNKTQHEHSGDFQKLFRLILPPHPTSVSLSSTEHLRELSWPGEKSQLCPSNANKGVQHDGTLENSMRPRPLSTAMEAVEKRQVLWAHLHVTFYTRFPSAPGPQRHTTLYGGSDLVLASVSGATGEIAH